MPTERRVTLRAGRLWYAKQYVPLRGSAPSSQRRERREYSSEIRESINFRTSIEKLWLLLECNFKPNDLYVSFSYRPDMLPKTKSDAEKYLKQFIRALRQERKPLMADLLYVYATEGYHSDNRFHHHMILNAAGNDYAVIRSLWSRYGDNIEILPYRCKTALAHAEYLTKEPRERGRHRVGERMWRTSRNLKRPIVVFEDVPAGEKLTVPQNARVVKDKNVNNVFGRFQYVAAILEPDIENTDLG